MNHGSGRTTVSIIGLGLMGGSLGMALRKRKLARVLGYARRHETRKLAKRLGAADEVFDDPSEAVRLADVVVFCVPVLAVPEVLAAVAGAIRAGAVVTDVGSTKAWLHRRCSRILAGTSAVYVGSHPMAGSEKTGIEWARADLFNGAAVAVTVSPHADGRTMGAANMLVRWWGAIGCRAVIMSPREHDRIVARTSHVPHVASAALARMLVGRDKEILMCGPGIRDATRLAAGSDVVWHDILRTNAAPVAKEIARLQSLLAGLKMDLERGNYSAVRKFLADARVRRGFLEGARPAGEKKHGC